MNILRARIYLCILLALFSCYAFAGKEDLVKALQQANQIMEDSFLKFKTDGNTDHLYEADKQITQLSQRWKEDPNLVRPKLLEFQLKLLQMCFESHDKNYDLGNPPVAYINVPLPRLTPGLMSGMDPADIQDPEIRKEYEAAVAENKRREEKYAREKNLQYFIESGLSIIHGYINLSKELGTLESDAKIIKNTITNVDLMKKIKEEILVDFYDEKGVPRNK